MNQNTLKKIISIINKPFAKMILFSSKYQGKLISYHLRALMTHLSNGSDYYFQYRKYEKLPSVNSNNKGNYSEFAIVLQGGIKYEDDFTKITILQYKTFFPGVRIIVSSWDSESEEFYAWCEKEEIICLKNKKPDIVGAGNRNLQIISSYEGAKKALELGCLYTIKTRTDQRFYAPSFLTYLKNVLLHFDGHDGVLKGRLVFMQHEGSYQYWPFHLSDFMIAGYAEDMEKYLDTTLYSTNQFCPDYNKKLTKIMQWIDNIEGSDIYDGSYIPADLENIILETCPSEVYIPLDFFCRYYGIPAEGEYLKSYWRFLSNNCVIIDNDSVQFYWPKYKYLSEVGTKLEYTGRIDHGIWLDMLNSAGKL